MSGEAGLVDGGSDNPGVGSTHVATASGAAHVSKSTAACAVVVCLEAVLMLAVWIECARSVSMSEVRQREVSFRIYIRDINHGSGLSFLVMW